MSREIDIATLGDFRHFDLSSARTLLFFFFCVFSFSSFLVVFVVTVRGAWRMRLMVRFRDCPDGVASPLHVIPVRPSRAVFFC